MVNNTKKSLGIDMLCFVTLGCVPSHAAHVIIGPLCYPNIVLSNPKTQLYNN